MIYGNCDRCNERDDLLDMPQAGAETQLLCKKCLLADNLEDARRSDRIADARGMSTLGGVHDYDLRKAEENGE